MKFTVFTPAYNRAYTLRRLYESLRQQTVYNFEWLIVDDGSTDDTPALCATFESDLFPVRYYRTADAGKCVAINTAAPLAAGEWFYIVDSDDWLPADAMQLLADEEQCITSDRVGVLCGMRHEPSGHRIGGDLTFERVECTAFDFRYRMRVKGDLAEVIRTDIVRQMPFPQFEGERFCPPAVLFNRIARSYLTHYFNRNIYYCKYLPDGLTAHIVQLRMASPQTVLTAYAEQAGCPVPFRLKVRSWINFWRFSFCLRQTDFLKRFRIPRWAWLCRLPGWCMHRRDLRLVRP